jgi:hypothetical protein
MLAEGDIVEIKEGMKVYAEVPEHFLYANRRGVFNRTAHGEVQIEGTLAYLAGRYVVYKTAMNGGGTGMGPHDIYPDGHHVYCEKLDDQSQRIDFYQSGAFSAMLPNLKAVGRAQRRWVDG